MKSNLPLRRLIPKWRPFASTLRAFDAAPLGGRNVDSLVPDYDEFDQAIRRWKETQTTGALGDLLSFGIHHELSDRVAALGHDALKTAVSLTDVQRLLITDLAIHHGLLPTQPIAEFQTTSHTRPFEASIRAVSMPIVNSPEGVRRKTWTGLSCNSEASTIFQGAECTEG
jgi:hypothetical protein